MVGVFLGPLEPVNPAPARLSFVDADFPYLYPALGQMFFIGDGRNASGNLQEFHVPAGASRLALGGTDLCSGGTIGCFDDNTGAYQVNMSVASAPSSFVQVDLSRFPNGALAPVGLAIANQWQPLGILFSARRPDEPVGITGSVLPVVPGATGGVDCQRFYFFSPDTPGAVGIFRFVQPGTTTPADASYFEMLAGWDPGESVTLVGLDQAGAVTAQRTFTAPCDCDGIVHLSGRFHVVEVRTQGNPGIGFGNCGLGGNGYGLRFTRAAP
jgi:hypothetical protein